MTESTCVNIACGDSYIAGWYNFDYAAHSANVTQANLLGVLPLPDGVADLVYSSHFLEHIPRDCVATFLSECFRITKRRGRLRLVLPDWEELCRTYLSCRQEGEHDRADFLILEMIDQCVRSRSGGELGAYYGQILAAPELHADMVEFVRRRTGHLSQSASDTKVRAWWHRAFKNPRAIAATLEHWYCRAVLALLPRTFSQQNVSFATVGERHAWVYDYYSVEKLLREAGFTAVQRMTAYTSSVPGFPHFPLDVSGDGLPRKGAESMYIEAIRP